ncbi:hypothetical protein EGW08_009142, partial [Elysia chlorotica]
GLVPQDMKLLGAQVVIRHGDRAPLMHLPGDEAPPLPCLVDARQFSHIPKLQNYEQVMAQAAQEYELGWWAMYPSRPECGEGQLTGQGAMQQVLSGLHLHQRYTEPPHSLPLDHSTVAIHSTIVSRTYQSALAFAFGLLPEFDRKQVKVQASHSFMFCDPESAPGSVCHCPGFESLRNQAVASCRGDGTVAQSLTTYEATAAKTLARVFGVSPAALPSPEGVMDGLSRYMCHSIPPPCVTTATNSSGRPCVSTTCIDAALMEPYLKFSVVATHGLMMRIAQGMHSHLLPGQTPLVALYSGHDTTLSPLLAALGLNDQVWPGYATRLVFELYRRAAGPDVPAQHFVRILLNGKPVTSQTVFCRAGSALSGGDDLCEFERFHSHVTSMKVHEFCASLGSSKAQSM